MNYTTNQLQYIMKNIVNQNLDSLSTINGMISDISEQTFNFGCKCLKFPLYTVTHEEIQYFNSNSLLNFIFALPDVAVGTVIGTGIFAGASVISLLFAGVSIFTDKLPALFSKKYRIKQQKARKVRKLNNMIDKLQPVSEMEYLTKRKFKRIYSAINNLYIPQQQQIFKLIDEINELNNQINVNKNNNETETKE